MAYNTELAGRIRNYLAEKDGIVVEEKKMFGGLAFMVNGKMCINASGNGLMCRFDPALHKEVSKKKGYQPMIMKGKHYEGYCYVEPAGFSTNKDFNYWMQICLDFNHRSRPAKKSSKAKGTK